MTNKLGKPFQLVVSDVLKEFDPEATVREGVWVDGPDASREIDVLIEGTVDGANRRVQVECRDYNPGRGPIGIAQIDALESKHRDLAFDVSLLCSNAGFTTPAIRKASRLGIGLIGVLRENDERVRYRIVDEIYIRRIDIVPGRVDINFNFLESIPQPSLEQITYNGRPVVDWLKHRISIFLGSNPVVRGIHLLSFRFQSPISLSVPYGQVMTDYIKIRFEISGGWFAQQIEIDATCGLYDWIRRAIRLGPKCLSGNILNPVNRL